MKICLHWLYDISSKLLNLTSVFSHAYSGERSGPRTVHHNDESLNSRSTAII